MSAYPAVPLLAQETADELIRSARFYETLGYTLAGVGFLVIVGGVVVSILLDRAKKRRRRQREE